MLIFVTVHHDACIENLLLRLNLFTFRIKLKAPPPTLRQMSDFTLSPPILAGILCNAPPLVLGPPLLIIIAQSLIRGCLLYCLVIQVFPCKYSLYVFHETSV